MSWQSILKNSSKVRSNWINSKTPPDMYYYDKLNSKLKKEFDEVFEKLIDDIQRGYLSQEEEMWGSHKTENVQGKFYLRDLIDGSTGSHFADFEFEIAPTSSSTDKYGRYANYYLYFQKSVPHEVTELTRTQPMYLTPEEWNNLMETILNVKR